MPKRDVYEQRFSFDKGTQGPDIFLPLIALIEQNAPFKVEGRGGGETRTLLKKIKLTVTIEQSK